MPAGFRNASGVDFDSVFDPYVEGTKPANTGHRTSDGVDLAGRYAPIVYGFKAPDVGFRNSAGVDVSNLWAAAGTASYLSNVSSSDSSFVGAATSASIGVRVMTDGAADFTAESGGTVRYHYPEAPGVGSLYEFRFSGTVNGLRNATGATASMTGKGGVSFTAAVSPGNSAAFDTGWLAADDANDFLTMQADSSGNNGLGQVDGTMTFQARRLSDSAIVRTQEITFTCSADSQL